MGHAHLPLHLSVKPVLRLLGFSGRIMICPEHSLHPRLLKSTVSLVTSVTSSAGLQICSQNSERERLCLPGMPPLTPKPKHSWPEHHREVYLSSSGSSCISGLNSIFQTWPLQSQAVVPGRHRYFFGKCCWLPTPFPVIASALSNNVFIFYSY